MSSWIVGLFLAFFVLEHAVEWGLALLNQRHVRAHGATVPPALVGQVDEETACRSRDYTLARGHLGLLSAAMGALLTLLVLFSGLLPAWDQWLAGAGLEREGWADALRFVGFLAGAGALFYVAALPFGLYGTFVIENRFGFNHSTVRTWVADRLKGLGFSVVIGLPFLYGVHAFMAYSGAAWWLWLFAFVAVVQLGLIWLYPLVIAPLFNRFTPLPEGVLRTRLEALAARAGFRTSGIFVMDASRRSGHSNAYFTGFLRPRIVLFDTLLQQMDEDQTVAVLAHEIGHYRAHHIHKALALNLAGMLVLLWVLSLLVAWEPFFLAFGFTQSSPHVALLLFMLCGGAFMFWLTPLQAGLSRRNEYAADAYSVQQAGLPQALLGALVKLNRENLANLHPHPWYSRYHYSHPTLLERQAAIERLPTSLPSAGA